MKKVRKRSVKTAVARYQRQEVLLGELEKCRAGLRSLLGRFDALIDLPRGGCSDHKSVRDPR